MNLDFIGRSNVAVNCIQQAFKIILLAALSAPSFGAKTPGEETTEDAFTSEERYNVSADNYGVLSHDLLGEQHDAYTGKVSFGQTDLIIPTNSALKLKVRRIIGGDSSFSYRVFGDWTLDLPRLYGPIPANIHNGVDYCTNTHGWLATKTLRPGSDPQDSDNGPLLAGVPTSSQLYAKKVTYSLPANTHFLNNENWAISCANGIYSAQAPNGTKYTFGHSA